MNSASTRCRCRWSAISSQSGHSRLTVPTNRSATAFAFGARTGVWMTRMPSVLKTVSKALVNYRPDADQAGRLDDLLGVPLRFGLKIRPELHRLHSDGFRQKVHDA